LLVPFEGESRRENSRYLDQIISLVIAERRLNRDLANREC
jgi:hypothetical protein